MLAPTVAPAAARAFLSGPPLLAHIRRRGEQAALCGSRVIGVPAPDDAPVCIVCADLEPNHREDR